MEAAQLYSLIALCTDSHSAHPSHACYFPLLFSITAVLTGVKSHCIVVLIGISLVTTDAVSFFVLTSHLCIFYGETYSPI